jgi:hypothetical protein
VQLIVGSKGGTGAHSKKNRGRLDYEPPPERADAPAATAWLRGRLQGYAVFLITAEAVQPDTSASSITEEVTEAALGFAEEARYPRDWALFAARRAIADAQNMAIEALDHARIKLRPLVREGAHVAILEAAVRDVLERHSVTLPTFLATEFLKRVIRGELRRRAAPL